MEKKLIYGLMAAVIVLLICTVSQSLRWGSIEAVTARFYEMKTARDTETKRINAIIHQANGSEEANS